jgi:hypothetical protein
MEPLTILHISDLHRDPKHEITNLALLNSLERDRDRYRMENPAIPAPNLIIVSGDVVHGVGPNAANPVAELDHQYVQAEEFLAALADSFVGGDRERVVIIPGNHDVSFYHTLQSMTVRAVNFSSEKGKEAARGYARRLSAPNSEIRWSWSECCFYEITNREMYNARLDAFCSFYARFYKNKRTYSLKSDEQSDIFHYPSHNVTIAGLSSCHENDPLNKRGEIHPDCLAGAARLLRQPAYRDHLLVAVWHHNTSGGPSRSDYMDSDILQVLIDDGFSLGFHGHQHKPQFIEERYQFGGGRKITVVSAGTLCAGPSELPSGEPRAYNLLQFDPESYRATLHQRRMQNDNFGCPIWGAGHFLSTGRSFVEFDVQRPIQLDRRASDTAAIGAAEQLLRVGRHREAANLLIPIVPSNPLARRFLLECYVSLGDSPGLIAAFYPPASAAEIIHVADALWEEKDITRLQEILGSDTVRNATDPAVISMRDKHLARLK